MKLIIYKKDIERLFNDVYKTNIEISDAWVFDVTCLGNDCSSYNGNTSSCCSINKTTKNIAICNMTILSISDKYLEEIKTVQGINKKNKEHCNSYKIFNIHKTPNGYFVYIENLTFFKKYYEYYGELKVSDSIKIK